MRVTLHLERTGNPRDAIVSFELEFVFCVVVALERAVFAQASMESIVAPMLFASTPVVLVSERAVFTIKRAVFATEPTVLKIPPAALSLG